MTKVFIVGSAGTTGLRLHERLSARQDVELLTIPEDVRKDPSEIRKIMAQSDFTFLCLPDKAAVEMAELAKDLDVRIIDTSTAHRTSDGWCYGFPELSLAHRESIASAKYTASPGCHASGFISLVYPLMSAGVLPKDAQLSCTSLTGYSGGGKKMIAEYEAPDRPGLLSSAMLYAMGQQHKHLPEMAAQCGLSSPPVFLPVVGDFHSGMLVSVSLHRSQLNADIDLTGIRNLYKEHYKESKLISICDTDDAALYASKLAGMDSMEIHVSGNEDRILLCSLFDNLGKGASGAAIQCFNIMCSLPEDTGLNIG